MNDFQQNVMTVIAAWADQHACLQRVYVFGSVARGDMHPESDIDVAVEYVPELHDDQTLMADFDGLQGQLDGWVQATNILLGYPLHIQDMFPGDPPSHVRPAILEAAATPVAVRGKVVLVATPKV